MLTAWGDESQSNSALDPGAYVLAAAVANAEDMDTMRQAMARLLLPGTRKVHWRDDNDRRHLRVIDQIATMPVSGLVVVRCVPGDRAEWSRRKCLTTLLAELQAMGCVSLTLESRGQADDRRDLDMTRHVQRQQRLGSDVRVFHQVGPKEPLLWIADALCGAMTLERCGRPDFLDRLRESVPVSVVDAHD